MFIKLYKVVLGIFLLFLGCLNASAQNYPANTPVALNGKLKVSGTQLVNACGNPIQLRGMSTHGPQWYQNCYSEESLDVLVKDWGISIFRLAMYVEEQGYVNNPNFWRGWIDNMVDACGKRGIYCLIDWHVLNPGNPNANKSAAIDFWKYMSTKHGSKAHVLYEICNEPNGVDWGTVKSYATDIISTIRNNNDPTVIIVGTPTWSQDVDIASQNKLTGDNIMYTLHFYAGSHRGELRSKAQTALSNGAPIFITEFGTSHASGDANYSPDETKTWINWANERKISWVCWSYADKGEVSSTLIPGSCNSKNWNNTSECGTLIKGLIKANPFSYIACNGDNNNQQPDNNNNNNNQQPDNNNNNNNQQPDNNNNNNNQQPDNNNNNNQQPDNNNNNNQQPDNNQPVVYPSLVQNVTNGDVYRIVNKNSGKVMAIENGAELKQVTRNEQDSKQLFSLEEKDGYYFMRSVDSKSVLTNKYVNNDGTAISQEEVSNYDNPSQKWGFKKANEWFLISNKSDYSASKVLAVENASKSDNAKVVIFSSKNSDEQLWGLEYVYTPDKTDVEVVPSAYFAVIPSAVEDVFVVGTVNYDEQFVVDVYAPNGGLRKHFESDEVFNVGDLAKGPYLVVVSDLDGKRLYSQVVIKK
ncbi:MAG: cellulase family glycosylhydrolase [Paludibacteraceae bacterium]|nr:cellulase family glycosylhydrolase [Paludibacteraceae bacterium]